MDFLGIGWEEDTVICEFLSYLPFIVPIMKLMQNLNMEKMITAKNTCYNYYNSFLVVVYVVLPW